MHCKCMGNQKLNYFHASQDVTRIGCKYGGSYPYPIESLPVYIRKVQTLYSRIRTRMGTYITSIK